jgi:hypothetical protein
LHELLILLAYDSDSYKIVDAYYDKTIKATDEEAKKSGARHFLEYTKGRLHVYCGPNDTRSLVLSRWETIASHLRDHDTDYNWRTRMELIHEYTKAWMSLSSQSGAEQHEQQQEINKLNKLNEMNNDLNTYSLYREAKLTLARFLSTHDQLGEARELLKPLVKKALEQARTVDEAEDGYERLAFIFPVINDDVNALAAWSALSPLRAKEGDRAEDGNTPTVDKSTAEPAAMAGATENDDALDEHHSHDEFAKVEQDSDDLTGNLGLVCDGRCGRQWSYADDLWVCRDCLCVQLDTNCFDKLRRSELPITICHPKHEYLHVPPFDVNAWKALKPADLQVGLEIMSRDAWLSKLEQEWSIEK